MVIATITAKVISSGGPTEIKVGHKSALKDSYRGMAVFHHTRQLRKKFNANAPAEYGFQRRSRKYLEQKQKLKKTKKHLFWSGQTEQLVLGTRIITASSQRATMRLVVPKHFRKRRKDFAQPDKVAELREHSVRDVRGLTKEAKKIYVGSLNSRRRRRKRRLL